MPGADKGPRGAGPPDEATAAQERLVAKAAEKLLVAMMDDTEQRVGMSGSLPDGKSAQRTRLCDMAAYVLSRKLPQKYQFDMSAPLGDRDRQRATMINVWRKEQSLPPLPEP